MGSGLPTLEHYTGLHKLKDHMETPCKVLISTCAHDELGKSSNASHHDPQAMQSCTEEACKKNESNFGKLTHNQCGTSSIGFGNNHCAKRMEGTRRRRSWNFGQSEKLSGDPIGCGADKGTFGEGRQGQLRTTLLALMQARRQLQTQDLETPPGAIGDATP